MNILLRIKLIKSAIISRYYIEAISLLLFIVLIKTEENKLYIRTNIFNPILYIILFAGLFILFFTEAFKFLIEFKKEFLSFNSYSVSWTSNLHRFNKIFYNK